MDFEFSDEQRQLREAARVATKEYTFDRLRAINGPRGLGSGVAGLAEARCHGAQRTRSVGGWVWPRTACADGTERAEPAARAILTSAVIATTAAAITGVGYRAVARPGRGDRSRAGSLRTQLAFRDPLGRVARDPRGPGISARRPQAWWLTRGSRRCSSCPPARAARQAMRGGSLFVVPRDTPGLTLTEYSPSTDSARPTSPGRSSSAESSRLGGEGERSRRSRRPRRGARRRVRGGGEASCRHWFERPSST